MTTQKQPMREGDNVRGVFAHRVTGCPFCMECRQHPHMDIYVCGFVGASVTHEVDEPRIYNVWSVCENYNARFQSRPTLLGVDMKSLLENLPAPITVAKQKCCCDKRTVVHFGCKCGGV